MSQTADICLIDFKQKAEFFRGAADFGRSYTVEKFGLKESFFSREIVVGTTSGGEIRPQKYRVPSWWRLLTEIHVWRAGVLPLQGAKLWVGQASKHLGAVTVVLSLTISLSLLEKSLGIQIVPVWKIFTLEKSISICSDANLSCFNFWCCFLDLLQIN